MILRIIIKGHLVRRERWSHTYGVTLSNDLSDTFAIIHAEGAQGLSSIMPLVVVWIFGEMVLFLMLHPMRKIKLASILQFRFEC